MTLFVTNLLHIHCYVLLFLSGGEIFLNFLCIPIAYGLGKYSLGFKTKYYEQVQSKITRKNERG